MKRILLLLSVGLSIINTLPAMEMPQNNGEQDEVPVLDFQHFCHNSSKKLHAVKALDSAGTMVGYLTYRPSSKNAHTWRITGISVNQAYRKNKIGFTLFKTCIEDIQAQPNSTTVKWTALPLDYILSLDELINIYQRMVNKLGFAQDALKIGNREGGIICQQVKMKLNLAR